MTVFCQTTNRRQRQAESILLAIDAVIVYYLMTPEVKQVFGRA
jgi:hypothetical protein